MTRFGTGYVEIRPDFSMFDRLTTNALQGKFKEVGERTGRDFDKSFRQRTSGLFTPALKDLHEFAERVGKEKIPPLDIPIPELPKVPAPKVDRPAAQDFTVDARLDLKTAGAEAELEAIRARIAELNGQEATVEVRAQVGRAVAEMDRVEARLQALRAERAEVKVDVDQSAPGLFARMTASAQGLFTALGGSGGGGLGGATTRVTAGFLSFNSALGPVLLGVGALATAVGVSLVGAFAALASSLALAAAGVGALGAAVGGVLIPAFALGAATGSRLGKVFEALKAQDAAADQLGQRTAAGSAAAAAAAAQQEAASRSLADAQERLGEASKQAFAEMQDAAEAASDAIRGVAEAQQSLDEAKLSTREAKNELAKFRAEVGATGQAFGAVFDKFTDVSVDTSGLRKALVDANRAAEGPKLDNDKQLRLERLILNVRGARLREKEAIDGVSDAERERGRAVARSNQFVKQGKLASAQYRAALKSEQAATLAVAAARRDDGFSAAQAKANQLTADLTDQERAFLRAVKAVRTELRGPMRQASDQVLTGMTAALKRAPLLINPLRGAFTRLGAAWGRAIDVFSRDLVRPDTVNSLRAFTDGAAKLAGPITKGLSSLLTILLNIGQAALPALVGGTGKVADQLAGWAKSTGDQERMGHIIGGLVDHLKTWLGVGAAISRTFLAFFTESAAPGRDLAETIRKLADRTTAWLQSDEGRAQLKQFFHDVIPFVENLAGLIGRLVIAATRFGHVTARVLSATIDRFGGATSAADALVATVSTLAALKFAKSLITGAKTVAAGITAARRASVLLHAALTTTSAATRTLTGAQGVFRRAMNASATATLRQKATLIASKTAAFAMVAATRAWTAAQWLLNAALTANPIGLAALAVGGLVAAFALLGGKLSTITGAAKAAFGAITSAAKSAFDWVKGRWPLLLAVLTGPIGLAVLAVAKNWDRIKDGAKAALDFLKGTAGRVGSVIAGAVRGIAGRIAGFAGDVFDAAKGLAGGIARGIASVASKIASTAADAIKAAVKAVAGFAGDMYAKGRALLLKIRDGIKDIAGKVADAVKGAVQGGIDAIGGLADRVRNGGKRLGGWVVEGVKAGLGAIKDVGKTVLNALVRVLNRAIGTVNRLIGAANKINPLKDIPSIPDIKLRFRDGGPVPGFARGDRVAALLESQEFVIRRRIVERFGPTVFADINEGRLNPVTGYEPGERPSVQPVPASGPRFATGGLALATAGAERPHVTVTAPITVAGGGPGFDPLDASVKLARLIERRAGGDPRQD